MADHEEEIVIREISWEDKHDAKLKVSAGDDLQLIKDQVRAEIAQLWECQSPSNYCLVVTRIDPGPELVIVLGEGSGLLQFAPRFVQHARNRRMTVRTHIKRKGLIRMWKRLGLELDEYVLRG